VPQFSAKAMEKQVLELSAKGAKAIDALSGAAVLCEGDAKAGAGGLCEGGRKARYPVPQFSARRRESRCWRSLRRSRSRL
jgi:hypothetical protein